VHSWIALPEQALPSIHSFILRSAAYHSLINKSLMISVAWRVE
jgi:hypothetical protein